MQNSGESGSNDDDGDDPWADMMIDAPSGSYERVCNSYFISVHDVCVCVCVCMCV